MINEIKSRQIFDEARRWIPGGVNSPVRAYAAVGRTPRFIDSAKGSKIYDVDGNEYIDYVCSWGPGILGHGYPSVIEAVKKACDDGLSFGAPTKREVLLAQKIHEMMPVMEMSRLVSSGTEAVMSAIRTARGYTHRDMIVKFRGCYHGHSDGLLVKAGSAALTTAVPDSAGVPEDYTRNTLVAEYNDLDSVAELFEKYGDNIAAVIVEPVAANMGVVQPASGFLETLREITKDNGSLLIFDEVITGFRIMPGGAVSRYGVEPDLVTLGKIIGGGMPVGAYGGRREIMEVVSPLGPVYQAGTLSGNPIATAAGLETLTILQNNPDIYDVIERRTSKIAETVSEVYGDTVWINQVGSLMSVFFTDKPVINYESAVSSDTNRYASYFGKMLDSGIYLAPSQFEAMFISYAHSDDDIDRTCEILRSLR